MAHNEERDFYAEHMGCKSFFNDLDNLGDETDEIEETLKLMIEKCKEHHICILIRFVPKKHLKKEIVKLMIEKCQKEYIPRLSEFIPFELYDEEITKLIISNCKKECIDILFFNLDDMHVHY